MSYASVSDVEGMNTERTAYSSSTKPTLVQVQGFIDQIAGEIDTALSARSVLTPVTAPASFVSFLLHLNALGAAAFAEQAQFPEFDGGPATTSQGQRYYREYQDGLKSLKDGSAIDPAAPLAASDSLARSYLTDNPTNPGPDGSDGVMGNGYGNQSQPVFGMQKDF